MLKQTLSLLCVSAIALSLTACSMGPVASPPMKTYTINQLPTQPLAPINTNRSIVVMPMVATRGFDNSNMIYQTKAYQLNTFAENAWIAPPATMLTTLMSRTLQQSGAFRAVVAGPTISATGFTINSTLLNLYQDFSVNPSQIVLTIDTDLVQNSDNKVIVNKLFQAHIPTKENNPYGGVEAANQASADIMSQITAMVTKAIQKQNQASDS